MPRHQIHSLFIRLEEANDIPKKLRNIGFIEISYLRKWVLTYGSRNEISREVSEETLLPCFRRSKPGICINFRAKVVSRIFYRDLKKLADIFWKLLSEYLAIKKPQKILKEMFSDQLTHFIGNCLRKIPILRNILIVLAYWYQPQHKMRNPKTYKSCTYIGWNFWVTHLDIENMEIAKTKFMVFLSWEKKQVSTLDLKI